MTCLGQPPIPHVDMILGHLPTMYFVMFASSLSNSTAGDSEMKVKKWKIERYELNQLIQKRSEWVVDFTRRTKGRTRGTHPGSLVNSSLSVCEQQRKWEQAATVASCLAPSRFLSGGCRKTEKLISRALPCDVWRERAADADERPVNTPSWDLASEQTACVVGNHSLSIFF